MSSEESPVRDLTFVARPGSELSADELHEILVLRVSVFVVEQECAYQEVDGLDVDGDTVHVWARTARGMAAYARILPPAGSPSEPRIGRVVVAHDHRGSGLGRPLMRAAISEVRRRWPGTSIRIGAQAHLRDFYSSLGFVAAGEVYDEDGIAHVDMRLVP